MFFVYNVSSEDKELYKNLYKARIYTIIGVTIVIIICIGIALII